MIGRHLPASFPAHLPLAILAAAVLLRVGAALVTESHPLFPPYYYTDAREYHTTGIEIARAMKDGSPIPAMTIGKGLYSLWTGLLYRLAGPRPIVPKLLNALLTGGTIWLLYRLACLVVPPWPAALCAALLAAWPSHIFYTSQHLKEAAMLALLAGAFFIYLRQWEPERQPSILRQQAAFAAGAGLIILMGFFRTHLIPVICIALAAGGVVQLRRHRGDRRVALSVLASFLWLATSMGLVKSVSASLQNALGTPVMPEMAGFLPKATGGSRGSVSPFSPENLAQYRRLRLEQDQYWSNTMVGRAIDTQLFPDLEFHTWWDVLKFLPKGMSYVLFMPLPGLYPLGRNVGRILSSLENTALLAIFILAAIGAWRAPKRPAAVSFLVFFCLMVPPSALLEFDLGGASRHRLQFFPFLFPFAASVIATWLQKRGIIGHEKTEHPHTGL